MSDVEIRPALPADGQAIHEVVERAFGQTLEAILVDLLVADGDAVLELVAEAEGAIVGHVLFSRLTIGGDESILSGGGAGAARRRSRRPEGRHWRSACHGGAQSASREPASGCRSCLAIRPITAASATGAGRRKLFQRLSVRRLAGAGLGRGAGDRAAGLCRAFADL